MQKKLRALPCHVARIAWPGWARWASLGGRGGTRHWVATAFAAVVTVGPALAAAPTWAGAGEVAAASADAGPASTPARRSRQRTPPITALDARVRLLAKELDLDAAQQAAMKLILVEQGAEVSKVWNDASVPAPVRIGATQTISEKTASRIRAILNDEQREKYMKAHQHDAPVGAPGLDVQQWMKSAQEQEPAPNATSSAVAKGR